MSRMANKTLFLIIKSLMLVFFKNSHKDEADNIILQLFVGEPDIFHGEHDILGVEAFAPGVPGV